MRRLICLLCVFVQTGWADLHLELTRGKRQATPLSFVSSQGPGAPFLQSIIADDLLHSGTFVANDSQPLVTVALRQFHSQPRLAVEVTLKTDRVASSTLKLTGVLGRPFAHQLADAIYQKVTGIRGVFSTKIAYVLKQRVANHWQYHLMISDFDGQRPHAIVTSTEPLLSPSWSPKGDRLAYVSFESQRARVFVQTLRTGKRHQVAARAGIKYVPGLVTGWALFSHGAQSYRPSASVFVDLSSTATNYLWPSH